MGSVSAQEAACLDISEPAPPRATSAQANTRLSSYRPISMCATQWLTPTIGLFHSCASTRQATAQLVSGAPMPGPLVKQITSMSSGVTPACAPATPDHAPDKWHHGGERAPRGVSVRPKAYARGFVRGCQGQRLLSRSPGGWQLCPAACAVARSVSSLRPTSTHSSTHLVHCAPDEAQHVPLVVLGRLARHEAVPPRRHIRRARVGQDGTVKPAHAHAHLVRAALDAERRQLPTHRATPTEPSRAQSRALLKATRVESSLSLVSSVTRSSPWLRVSARTQGAARRGVDCCDV